MNRLATSKWFTLSGVPVPDLSCLARSGGPTLEFSLLNRFASKFESMTTAATVPRVEWKSSRFSIILYHFGRFDCDIASSQTEKFVFWGRDRFVFHIFRMKNVFKNEKFVCFLKELKLSFLTVPLRASNSQWSPRTIKNKIKL